MHPRTDFLLRSPLRLPYPRKHGVPIQQMEYILKDKVLKGREQKMELILNTKSEQ